MKTIIVIIFLISANIISAQVTQEWVATYNGSGTGGYNADKAAVDKFGNFIVAGRGGTENTDILILKYSTYGNLLWERRYNGLINDQDLFRDMIFRRRWCCSIHQRQIIHSYNFPPSLVLLHPPTTDHTFI